MKSFQNACLVRHITSLFERLGNIEVVRMGWSESDSGTSYPLISDVSRFILVEPSQWILCKYNGLLLLSHDMKIRGQPSSAIVVINNLTGGSLVFSRARQVTDPRAFVVVFLSNVSVITVPVVLASSQEFNIHGDTVRRMRLVPGKPFDNYSHRPHPTLTQGSIRGNLACFWLDATRTRAYS